MKLSDVMSAMQLCAYAELGLLLFLLAFVLIAVDLLRRKKSELEEAQMLPLEDERKEGRLP
jgi:cbb3-type cytochrome oxidase subunit 3